MGEDLGATLLAVAGWLGVNTDLLSRYGPRLLSGLRVTLELVLISVAVGFVLAVGLALARNSTSRVLRWGSLGFITFFRGTPLIAQIYLLYYGAGEFRLILESVGLWAFFREAYWCALLTFTLNTAAYQAEILRGGILAVPAGQVEAARALGLRPSAIFLRVVFPQAVLVGLRPLGNELILMLKASAIASVITVYDLMGSARLAFARSYDFEVYLWTAVLYLLLVEIIRRLWDRMEAALSRPLATNRH